MVWTKIAEEQLKTVFNNYDNYTNRSRRQQRPQKSPNIVWLVEYAHLKDFGWYRLTVVSFIDLQNLLDFFIC